MDRREGCPAAEAGEMRKRPSDARLIDDSAQRLIHGEVLTPEEYIESAGISPDALFKRIEVLVTQISEQTPLHEPTPLEERVKNFHELVQIVNLSSRLGRTALSAFTMAAQLDTVLPNLVECSSDHIYKHIPQDPESTHPDSLPQLLAPTFEVLNTLHNEAAHDIHPLLPRSTINTSQQYAILGRHHRGHDVISHALHSFKDEELRHHLLQEMPYRNQIDTSRELDAAILDSLYNDLQKEITEAQEDGVRESQAKREDNYIDQLVHFISTYAAARQQGYSPESARKKLTQSIKRIGEQSRRFVYDTTGAFMRSDLSPNGESPQESLTSLLHHAQYIRLPAGENEPPIYDHLPPPPDPHDPQFYFNDQEVRASGGQCPARVIITCSESMQAFVETMEDKGWTILSERERERFKLGQPRIKLATLTTAVALYIAEKTGLFDSIEQNAVFNAHLRSRDL